MNFALEQDLETGESMEINNKAFWDKLHEIFNETMEILRESAEEMGFDLDSIDDEEFTKQEELVRKKAQEQPYSRSAFEYAETVHNWFELNKDLFEEKQQELQNLLEADIKGVRPADEAVKITDCVEVIRWYQHQIYVKLCRAATGISRSEFEGSENFIDDANGSTKVAIIGIERSISAWGGLLKHFPEQEDSILDILVKLQRLLRQVETAFPNARKFIRPGLDMV